MDTEIAGYKQSIKREQEKNEKLTQSLGALPHCIHAYVVYFFIILIFDIVSVTFLIIFPPPPLCLIFMYSFGHLVNRDKKNRIKAEFFFET